MRNTQTLLACAVDTVRFCQCIAADCRDAASGAALRNAISVTLLELDQMESAFITVSHSHGLHFDGLPPVSALLDQIRLRLILNFRSSDSFISESMIKAFTDARIHLIRAVNQVQQAEPQTEILIQRLLGFFSASDKNLHPYL